MAASRQSRLRELLAQANRPGVLSFAVGLPATELFPLASLTAAHLRLLPSQPGTLQYGVPHRPLKRQIV
ncbi:MAG TPA: PLP-dependent aminotransferase family protein, partial [Thermoanaerobaculia bacterium]